MKFNFNKKLYRQFSVAGHKSSVISHRLSVVSRQSSVCGETLLEAIIAISIFTLILGPASALFTSSIRTVAMNRNDLVASALAEEGIEMVRNMRDTNLLKFSPKAEECWNTKPNPAGAPAITLNSCSQPENLIEPGSYRLALNPNTLDWDLIIAEADIADMTASSEGEVYRLKSDVQGESIVSDCDAPGNPVSCCNYTSLYFTSDNLAFERRGIPSPFYRKIHIEYFDSDADGIGDAADDIMKVITTVQYRSGSGVRTIQRSSILTNQPT